MVELTTVATARGQQVAWVRVGSDNAARSVASVQVFGSAVETQVAFNASATVVVALRPGAFSGPGSPPCVFNAAADTLACSFGPLPAGGSATLSGAVFFSLPSPPTPVDTTATRTASVPSDPVPGNDTDAAHCTYTGSPGIFPPPPTLRC